MSCKHARATGMSVGMFMCVHACTGFVRLHPEVNIKHGDMHKYNIQQHIYTSHVSHVTLTSRAVSVHGFTLTPPDVSIEGFTWLVFQSW